MSIILRNRVMGLVYAVVLLACWLPAAGFAEQATISVGKTELTEDEAKWQKVEDYAKARRCYEEGEAAYKAGLLETAVDCWMTTQALKPSEHTARMLEKARAELFEEYSAYANERLENNDPVTAYICLDSISRLLPDHAQFKKRLAAVKGNLTPAQMDAAEGWKEADKYYREKDFPKAKEAIQKVVAAHGTKYECILEAHAVIMKAYRENQYTIEYLPSDLFVTPEVAFENYYWVEEKVQTVAVPQPNGGSIRENYVIIYSLHGRLRNRKPVELSNVTIEANLVRRATGERLGVIKGKVSNIPPLGKADVVFQAPTGKSLTSVTTTRAGSVSKDDITATVSLSKTEQIPEYCPVTGYAVRNDSEDISILYDIQAYRITTEMAGSGAHKEQYRPPYLLHKNY